MTAETEDPDTPGTSCGTGQAVCERCGGGFHCGANDPTPCACTGVQLTADHRAALRRHYRHCLCTRCLAAITTGAPVALGEAHSPQGQ